MKLKKTQERKLNIIVNLFLGIARVKNKKSVHSLHKDLKRKKTINIKSFASHGSE